MTRMELIVILTSFFACLISKSNAEFPISRPYPNSREWRVIEDRSNDQNRAYLACKPMKGYFARSRDCILGYHKLTHSEEDHICNVNLQVTGKGRAYIYDDPIIYLFGKDKVIVMWRELAPITYLHIRIITPNGCKTTDTKIHDRVSENFRNDYTFASGETSFDVFFENDTCGDKICWMTIDNGGIIINGPIGYYEAKDRNLAHDVQRIDENAPEKGHLFTKRTKGLGTDYFLRKPDGTEKLLAHSLENEWFGTSLANNLIGICFKTATLNKCAQYDSDGRVKLEMIMDLPNSMYNLANGGFVFTSNHEEKCKQRDCPEFYLVTKISANGTKLGSFKCSGDVDYQYFYQNEEGKHCLTMPCDREASVGNSTIQCFDDTVFSK